MKTKSTDYFNEKLNIRIKNNNVYELQEFDSYVELHFRGKLRAKIFLDSYVEVYDSTTIIVRNNSNVYVYGDSTVRSHDYSRVKLYDESLCIAYDESYVEAKDKSRIRAYDKSVVGLLHNSQGSLFDIASGRAYDYAKVDLYSASSCLFYDKVKAYLHGQSRGEFYSKSSGHLYRNSDGIFSDKSSGHLYDESKGTFCDSTTFIADGKSVVKLRHDVKGLMREFSVAYIRSSEVKIKRENHFGSIIKQVFKTRKTMIVYKKLKDGLIATLELSKGQEFQCQLQSKCRTDKAKVIKIENCDGTHEYKKGYSQFNDTFEYVVGQIVRAKYDTNINECSSGIHFFLTREEAKKY